MGRDGKERTVLGEPPTDKAAEERKSAEKADIDIPTISRLGGGAALGAVIGTWIFPGPGSLAGAALGGALGAFAPNILTYVKSGGHPNEKAGTHTQ